MASAAASKRPQFWIVAGPNGSGKSTLYGESPIEDFGRSIWIINPDLLSRRLHQAEGLEPMAANAEALDRIQAWLKTSLRAHQNIGVETVLSTPKYRDLVHMAKRAGYEFCLIYVCLPQVEMNLERIRQRVEKGGHAVEDAKVIARRARSLEQLPWFMDKADRGWVFDNAGAAPKVIVEKADGVTSIYTTAFEDIRNALKAPSRQQN